MYIKNGEINSGYLLRKADGSISFNAPKEDWLAEGWEEYAEFENIQIEPESNPVENLQTLKREIIGECTEFYNSVILQVQIDQQFDWIPINLRAAYRDTLEDLKAVGETKVNWKGKDILIDEAVDYLKKVNVYEYRCKKIYDTHIKNISKLETTEEMEMYDYTKGYLPNLIL